MDFIEDFIRLTAHLPAGERFRRWTAIAACGAALERRCWTPLVGGHFYPNMFILLLGGPASGKTVPIGKAQELLTGIIPLAPDSATKASFLDALAEAQVLQVHGGDPIEYTCLAVVNDEFGNFLKEYDHVFLNVLNRLYDGRPTHDDRVRHGGFSVNIQRPLVSILAGTQPDYLSLIMPDSAWNTGFMTRTVMVFSGDEHYDNDVWADPPEENAEWGGLRNHLCSLTKWYGPFKWEKSAQREWSQWRSDRCPPSPPSPRLRYYASRRAFFVVKLGMASAASRGSRLVTRDDLSRARDWLIDAERDIDEIFARMSGKASDRGTLDDMMAQVRKAYVGTPLPESTLLGFLAGKVPVERMERIIGAAVKMSLLECTDPIFKKAYRPMGHNPATVLRLAK